MKRLNTFLVLICILLLSSCAMILKWKAPEHEIHIREITQKQRLWHVVNKVYPEYHRELAERRVSGCLKVKIGINQDGEPQYFNISQSFPRGLFNKELLKATKRWNFEPHESNTRKKPGWLVFEVVILTKGATNQGKFEKICRYPDPKKKEQSKDKSQNEDVLSMIAFLDK